MIIDFHTHRQRQDSTFIEVISLHAPQVIDRPFKYHTIGFHPWSTFDKIDEKSLTSLARTYVDNNECLGIGECGLDNLKGANIELQEEIFLQQIHIANQINSPVIIHCVRAFDRLLRLRKKYGQTPWVVHGFVRNKMLAKQAIEAGLLLSLAPHEQMTDTFKDTLLFLPLDCIFLETDSDTKVDIINRYRIFANLRSLPIEKIEIQIFENFKKLFINKWKHQNG